MSKMAHLEPIPGYQDNLAYFLGDLRSCTYSSQSKIARIMGLSHTTISRYENGHLRPPVGYLAHLASRLTDQIDPTDNENQEKKERILSEVNQAIKWCFPDEVPFQNWEELQDIANYYLESRQLPEEKQKGIQDQFNWRVTPLVENFCGRLKELNQLESLINFSETNIILILGMGGIGKTTLATKLADRLENKFEFVIWISLYNSPTITDLINCISGFLPPPLITNPSQPLEQQIHNLINFFREHRCLIIFDNMESVMQSGDQIGSFRPGFEEYNTLLKAVASNPHQSCLLITSREYPIILNELAKPSRSVHIYNLKGLQTTEAEILLEPWGFATDTDLVETLNLSLSGNPLALIMAAEVIETFYFKDIASFLQTENLVVGDIRHFLDKSFDRCSNLSKIILYWLATIRNPAPLQRIEELMIPRPMRSDIVEAIHSLIRSSLVENHAGKFGLQTFVAEYIHDRFIRQTFDSILEGQPGILQQVALFTTDSNLHVQKALQQNLIQPIINLLKNSFEHTQIIKVLNSILEEIRETNPVPEGYCAGNLINIMLHLNQDLPHMDFSHLTIRHANFQGHTLHEADFSNTRFIKCVFDNTFQGVNALALSPTSNYLAVAVERDIRVWNLIEKQPYMLLSGHTDLVWNLVFGMEDHALFSQGADNFVHRWNLKTGEIELSVKDPDSPISALAINSDASFLATGNKAGGVVLWNAQNGQKLLSLHANPRMIRTLTLDPTGKKILAGYKDGKITVWDISSNEFYALSDVHQGPVTAAAFFGDGEIFSTGGADGIISIRKTSNGKLLQELSGHKAGITVLRYSPKENMLVSGSLDKTASTWDLETGDRKLILEGHTRSVRSLDLNFEGNILATGSYDRTIRLWDLEQGGLVDKIEGLTFDIRTLAFSPDGETVASGGSDYQVRFWDLRTKKDRRTENGHDRWVSSVAFSPDGKKLASASYDRTVYIWDVKTGAGIKRFFDFSNWIYCLAFHPNGNILGAGGEDGSIRLWNLESVNNSLLLKGHTAGMNCLAFSLDGKTLCSGGEDQTICIWQLENGNLLKKIESIGSPIMHVAFGPAPGTLLFVTKDCQIGTFEIQSGKLLMQERVTSGQIEITKISPQNELLAVCTADNPGSIILWDIKRKAMIFRELISHSDITSLAFNQEGKLLAIGNFQGEIIIWDTVTRANKTSLTIRKPYDGLNISNISGLSFEQIETLKALGAVD